MQYRHTPVWSFRSLYSIRRTAQGQHKGQHKGNNTMTAKTFGLVGNTKGAKGLLYISGTAREADKTCTIVEPKNIRRALSLGRLSLGRHARLPICLSACLPVCLSASLPRSCTYFLPFAFADLPRAASRFLASVPSLRATSAASFASFSA